MQGRDAFAVTTEAQLEALSGVIQPAAQVKEVDHLPPVYQAMIAASPFVILTTLGPNGLDASPRGDAPGFAQVEDARTLLLPERRGNNRIDTLRNLVHDPRVGMLFLIPGHGETLRVNGRAVITRDPSLLARFVVDGKPPKCVLVVTIETAFFQCARAIRRARLWERASEPLPDVPTTGTILAALSRGEVGGEAYDRELTARQQATLY